MDQVILPHQHCQLNFTVAKITPQELAKIYTDENTPWDYKINGNAGVLSNQIIPAYSADYAIPIEINNDSIMKALLMKQ